MGFTGSVVSSFKALRRGEISEYTQLLEDSRRHAIDRMVDNARLMGADAIIAVRFDSSEIGQQFTEIVSYGTAVKVRPCVLAARARAAQRRRSGAAVRAARPSSRRGASRRWRSSSAGWPSWSAATTWEEAAAVLADLPALPGDAQGPSRDRPRWGRGHGDADAPHADWRPTDERFRDPRTNRVMRVWEDAGGGRHYVPDEEPR